MSFKIEGRTARCESCKDSTESSFRDVLERWIRKHVCGRRPETERPS